jgi:hypothetical protein
MDRKPRIAHLAGPNATIQNTPPLVTSNKARAKHHLPLLTDPEGKPATFDVLRPQRLAAPVTVYVEQFSAHPLEADAAELYGRRLHRQRRTRAQGTAKRQRQACLRSRAASRRRALSFALHGDAGRWQRLGGGMRVPQCTRSKAGGVYGDDDYDHRKVPDRARREHWHARRLISSSQPTHRWREMDSNFRFRARWPRFLSLRVSGSFKIVRVPLEETDGRQLRRPLSAKPARYADKKSLT